MKTKTPKDPQEPAARRITTDEPPAFTKHDLEKTPVWIIYHHTDSRQFWEIHTSEESANAAAQEAAQRHKRHVAVFGPQIGVAPPPSTSVAKMNFG